MFNTYKKQMFKDREDYTVNKQFCSYIDLVLESETLPAFKSNIKNIPAVSGENKLPPQQVDFLEELFVAVLTLYKRKIQLTHSEAVFNKFLVEPFLQAVSNLINEDECAWLDAGFFPGEEHLLSMTKQLKQNGQFKDARFCLKADGVIRLQSLSDIEVCVAEISGVYKNTDMTKINLDHHKGMFGVVSMLKTIADEMEYASLDVFQKIKMIREDVLTIKPEFKDKEEFLKQAIPFYWSFKCQLEKLMKAIKDLQESHEKSLKQARNSALPPPLVSKLVSSSIIRLTEKEYCKGAASFVPFYSSEHG
ncbi:hypothetical protein G6F43_010788 [Rhizopus delemar]|nr:hypothetical protein G6F43_010788 [Rhizopus delemar]